MLAQAEAAVAALRDSYREQLLADVASLLEIWTGLEDGVAPSVIMSQIQSVAHNVKGQGGSFGYETADEINIVHAHIKILKMVSENDIAGTGGETGERIVAKLAALTR